MKEFRLIQKIAGVAGLCYGLWLGCRTDASDGDARNAFVIIVLVLVILLSLAVMKSKTVEE